MFLKCRESYYSSFCLLEIQNAASIFFSRIVVNDMVLLHLFSNFE